MTPLEAECKWRHGVVDRKLHTYLIASSVDHNQPFIFLDPLSGLLRCPSGRCGTPWHPGLLYPNAYDSVGSEPGA
ncbi:MAG: hypothetical protein JWM16_5042 [Verrucomicrobiales bacterium]|nr:hypothetical protein [Verrucomicrobiales bacterium]